MSQLAAVPAEPFYGAQRISSDQQAIRVAENLAEQFALKASERDAKRILPWDELEAYSRSGLGAITVPKAFGGADVSYVTLAKVFTLICAVDPSLGQIPQNHFAVLQLLKEHGSHAQQQRWYEQVLQGARLGNAGPERGRGSIEHSATVLRKTEHGLRLSGKRFYSTGALYAHWIPTRAVDENNQTLQVWVPAHAQGVQLIDDWSSFGQRTTASGTVVFDNVEIDPEYVIELTPIANIPNLAGPVSQLIQASIDVGIANGALQQALQLVRNNARPWVDANVAAATDDPYIIHEVGELQVQVSAANALLEAAAATLDRLSQQPITEASSAEASIAVAEAKVWAVEAALNASEQLLALAGSSATRAKHNADRYWRNARVHTLHDPVRWKYHLLGNYLLNNAYPRRHQWN